MSTSCLPPGLGINLLTGPMLLGYMFSYGLLGILVMQMFIYHFSFPSDALWMKLTVWSLFFFECLTTLFATISAWLLLGSGWGNIDALLILPWSFDPLPALSGFLASMVHFFFCWRIYKLTSVIWLPVIIGAISLVQCGMTFYIGIKVGMADRQVVELVRLPDEVIVWLVGSAVCDVMITLSMVVILLRATRKLTFSETNSILLRLVNFTVQTGMTTSFGAVLEVILFLVYRENNLHFILFLMLSKLYSNTLMASLNSRVVLAPSRTQQATRHNGSGSWEQVNPNWGRNTLPRVSTSKSIQITTCTEVTKDDLEVIIIKNRVDRNVHAMKEHIHDGGANAIGNTGSQSGY